MLSVFWNNWFFYLRVLLVHILFLLLVLVWSHPRMPGSWHFWNILFWAKCLLLMAPDSSLVGSHLMSVSLFWFRFLPALQIYFPKVDDLVDQGDWFLAIIGHLMLSNAPFMSMEINNVWGLLCLSCLTLFINSSNPCSVEVPCLNHSFFSRIYLLLFDGWSAVDYPF